MDVFLPTSTGPQDTSPGERSWWVGRVKPAFPPVWQPQPPHLCSGQGTKLTWVHCSFKYYHKLFVSFPNLSIPENIKTGVPLFLPKSRPDSPKVRRPNITNVLKMPSQGGDWAACTQKLFTPKQWERPKLLHDLSICDLQSICTTTSTLSTPNSQMGKILVSDSLYRAINDLETWPVSKSVLMYQCGEGTGNENENENSNNNNI